MPLFQPTLQLSITLPGTREFPLNPRVRDDLHQPSPHPTYMIGDAFIQIGRKTQVVAGMPVWFVEMNQVDCCVVGGSLARLVFCFVVS